LSSSRAVGENTHFIFLSMLYRSPLI
jgi:hypothetical protein